MRFSEKTTLIVAGFVTLGTIAGILGLSSIRKDVQVQDANLFEEDKARVKISDL